MVNKTEVQEALRTLNFTKLHNLCFGTNNKRDNITLPEIKEMINRSSLKKALANLDFCELNHLFYNSYGNVSLPKDKLLKLLSEGKLDEIKKLVENKADAAPARTVAPSNRQMKKQQRADDKYNRSLAEAKAPAMPTVVCYKQEHRDRILPLLYNACVAKSITMKEMVAHPKGREAQAS